MSETGTTDTFTVVLDAEPDSNVVILVSSADTGEATVNVASLDVHTDSLECSADSDGYRCG